MPGDTMDTIFSNIESATGVNFDDAPVSTNDEPTTNAPSGDNADSDVELQQVNNQLSNRETPVQKEEDLTDPLAKTKETVKTKPAGPKTNERGDLLDENGNVVAARGAERRVTFQNQKLREVNTNLKSQNDHLIRELAGTKALNGLPQQLGFKNEEVLELFEIGVAFKKNPAEGARKIIEAALAKGANLRDIINDENIPNIQTGAVQAMLDARLGPLQKQREHEQGVDRALAEGQAKANQFLADYPDADLHRDVLADQMHKIAAEYESKGVSPDRYLVAEKAWERIQGFAHKYGLDITQPLGPQIAARQTPSGARANPAGQVRRPMPNGSNGNGGAVVQTKTRQANPDDTYSSIVRESMAEAGYSFN